MPMSREDLEENVGGFDNLPTWLISLHLMQNAEPYSLILCHILHLKNMGVEEKYLAHQLGRWIEGYFNQLPRLLKDYSWFKAMKDNLIYKGIYKNIYTKENPIIVNWEQIAKYVLDTL